MSDALHSDGELRNPDVSFEPTDVNSRTALLFAAGLAVGLALTMAILWAFFQMLLDYETARKRS
jgi:hypothetical protein